MSARYDISSLALDSIERLANLGLMAFIKLDQMEAFDGVLQTPGNEGLLYVA